MAAATARFDSHWGGGGYLVSTFVSYAFPNADLVTQLLTVPPVIGEIWIMGYLIIVGVHDQAPAPATMGDGPSTRTEAGK